jgi:hypothetical protein
VSRCTSEDLPRTSVAPTFVTSRTTKEEPGPASLIPCAIFIGTFDTRPPMTRVGTLTNAYASHQSPKAHSCKPRGLSHRCDPSHLDDVDWIFKWLFDRKC